MKYWITSFALLTLISANCFAGKIKIDHSKWKKVFNKDGVRIEAQEIKGVGLIAFRATSVLKAPVEKLLAVLRDAKSAESWSKSLDSVDYIAQPDDLSATTYEVRNFPWPFDKRDLIIEYQMAINKKNKSIITYFNSVNHKNYPKNKKYVRSILHIGELELWPLSKGTKVVLTIMADPKGNIPKMVVNYFQQKVPFEFLKDLDKQALKTKTPTRPGILAKIQEYYDMYPANTGGIGAKLAPIRANTMIKDEQLSN